MTGDTVKVTKTFVRRSQGLSDRYYRYYNTGLSDRYYFTSDRKKFQNLFTIAKSKTKIVCL